MLHTCCLPAFGLRSWRFRSWCRGRRRRCWVGSWHECGIPRIFCLCLTEVRFRHEQSELHLLRIAERILLLVDEAMAIRDAFPVSQGYNLVFPCRHVGSFFKLTESERACVLELLAQAKADLDLSFYSDGFNIGIDDGAAVRLPSRRCVRLVDRPSR